MTLRVLDPTNEMQAAGGRLAERLASLQGKTVGFISNGKEGTKGYFTHLERMLREELGVADVVWRTKSNYSAPADAHIVAGDHQLACRVRRCRRLRQLLVVQSARLDRSGTAGRPGCGRDDLALRQRGRADGARARHARLQVRGDRPSDQQRVGRALADYARATVEQARGLLLRSE